MKRGIFLFFCCAAVGTVLRAAPPAPPGELYRMVRMIEKGTKVWKITGIEPLSNTVSEPFARNGWRVTMERPFESIPAAGIFDSKNLPDRKNNAELIFVLKQDKLDARKIRPLLKWKVAPNELYTTIHYLGEGGGLFCFVKSDVVTLDWTATHLRLKNGDSPAEALAEALNHEDENQFSRKNAVLLIRRYGNAALPPLKRSMGKAMVDGESILLHLRAVKSIGTPEAAAVILDAAASGSSEIADAVRSILREPPYLKELKDLYFQMAVHQYDLTAPIEASIQFGWNAELTPCLKDVSLTPKSFRNFMISTVTLDQFRRNSTNSPELGYMEQIKLLLTRSGDLAGTPRVISLSDKANEHQLKMQKEDLARVKPFEDALAHSANKDIAIVAALMLYMFDPGPQSPVSKDYVRRVRESGNRILMRLDRTRLLQILGTLRRNVVSEEESSLFSAMEVRLSN